MKTIVNNLAVEYSDEGSGPMILMLHGWADRSRTFDAVVQRLPGFRIVRVDMPGFGGSERPKATWSVSDYAAFIAAFCEKLQYQPEVIVGHSFGGRVAIKGAGTQELKPQKLVLIASAGVSKIRTAKNDALRFVAKAGKALTSIPPFTQYRQHMRKKLYGAIGSDYFTAGSMSDIYLKVIAEDLLPYAEKITIPTLLIWGRGDTSTPLADGERIHAAINGSRLAVLDASHFVHQEKAHEVAQLIKEFV